MPGTCVFEFQTYSVNMGVCMSQLRRARGYNCVKGQVCKVVGVFTRDVPHVGEHATEILHYVQTKISRELC